MCGPNKTTYYPLNILKEVFLPKVGRVYKDCEKKVETWTPDSSQSGFVVRSSFTFVVV